MFLTLSRVDEEVEVKHVEEKKFEENLVDQSFRCPKLGGKESLSRLSPV